MSQRPFYPLVLQRLIALSCLIALGFLLPNFVLAQTLPPPPPLEERWEMTNQPPFQRPASHPQDNQPKSVKGDFYTWSRLAYQSIRTGNWDIYYNSENFANTITLTNDPASDIAPRLNRGATQIVFSSKRDGDYEIFKINIDGSNLTQLTQNDKDDGAPIWSPDNSKILFQSYRDGQAEIYVMNADGSAQTRLTFDPNYDAQPDWSPDGKKIVFASKRSGAYRIWVMDANGANPTMLSNQSYSAHPKWSPDGTQIAYDADGWNDGWQQLWLMNADGSNQRLICSRAYNEDNTDLWAASWTPDGRAVAYTRIHYIYYENEWYWDYAYMQYFTLNYDLPAPIAGFQDVSISAESTNWNPDWKSADISAPAIQLEAPPNPSPSPISLRWTGADAGGSGLKAYNLQVKEGSGDWTSLLNLDQSLNTSYSYPGIAGHTYYFRISAIDHAFNQTPWPANYHVAATVETLPPKTSFNPTPAFANTTSSSLRIYWKASDPGGSGIKNFDVQHRIGKNGAWQDLFNGWYTEINVFGIPGETRYYRIRGVDKAGNVEDWHPGEDGDMHITYYSWNLSGIVHDNSGVPISSTQISLNPAFPDGGGSNQNGVYNVYGAMTNPVYTVGWSKAGYGSLPITDFKSEDDLTHQVVLPPADNVLQDGSFEAENSIPSLWQPAGSLASALVPQPHSGKASAHIGQPYWSGVETIQTVQNVSCEPRLGVDSHGTAHLIWCDPNGRKILYAYKARGGAWSAIHQIAVYNNNRYLEMVVDSANTLHMIWQDSPISVPGSSLYPTWYMAKPENGSWTTPGKLENYNVPYPALLSGLDGKVYLYGGSYNNLYYSVLSSGQWSQPARLPAIDFSTGFQVDQNGTIHTIWRDNLSGTVKYSAKPQNGVWTDAVMVSTDVDQMASVTLGIEPGGILHGLWRTKDRKLEHQVKSPGMVWGSSEKIGLGLNLYPHYYKITGNQGKIAILTTSYYGYPAKYRTYYIEKMAESGWSEPIWISSVEMSKRNSLAADPDGSFHIAWIDPNPDITTQELVRYTRNSAAGQSGTAVISQAVTIPSGLNKPTLSFYYNLGGGSTQNNTGFKIKIITPTGTSEVFSSQTSTKGWAFQSINLNAWIGQAVTLSFETNQVAGNMPTWVTLDDVSLGSSYPDLWCAATSVTSSPGKTVNITLNCGNRGGAPSQNARVALTLPAGLSLVSSQPAHASPAGPPTWNLGNLAPKANANPILLTLKIAEKIPIPSSLTALLALTSDSSEIEVGNNSPTLNVDIPYLKTYIPSLSR